MNLKHLLIIFFLFGCSCLIYSKGYRKRYIPRKHKVVKDSSMVKAYTDSLLSYKFKLDSVFAMKDTLNDKENLDTRSFRLFAPLTFYRSVAGNRLEHPSKSLDEYDAAIDGALMSVYIQHPELVKNTDEEIRKAGMLREDINVPIRHKVEYTSKKTPVQDADVDIPLQILVKKPNFWTFSGDYYLQFLQNYVSGNWYKGGESNYSMVASATLQANYNNKQKVKFENKLELKLGFQTSRSDSLHSFKTSEDLIRYTGKLGLQAAKNWYYTLQLVTYTQFMRGYKSNDPMIYSDILSPLNLNLSLGMSYTVKAFKGKLAGSVQMAPLAYNFRYVGRKELATRYGLKEGKHTLDDFGSECTVDLAWTFSDLIKWKTRLYGFTSYDRAEIEWENTISFQLNKYISSNIFIYPRFDDAASKRDDSHGYWQLKEYASIGFSYSF